MLNMFPLPPMQVLVLIPVFINYVKTINSALICSWTQYNEETSHRGKLKQLMEKHIHGHLGCEHTWTWVSIARVSSFTCAFVRTVRISAVCIHIAVTDVIFTFIQEKDLPPLAISQLINIAFPVPIGSSQYFPLMVFLPSLAFISRQDIAGIRG